jgi:hypothetical protein
MTCGSLLSLLPPSFCGAAAPVPIRLLPPLPPCSVKRPCKSTVVFTWPTQPTGRAPEDRATSGDGMFRQNSNAVPSSEALRWSRRPAHRYATWPRCETTMLPSRNRTATRKVRGGRGSMEAIVSNLSECLPGVQTGKGSRQRSYVPIRANLEIHRRCHQRRPGNRVSMAASRQTWPRPRFRRE